MLDLHFRSPSPQFLCLISGLLEYIFTLLFLGLKVPASFCFLSVCTPVFVSASQVLAVLGSFLGVGCPIVYSVAMASEVTRAHMEAKGDSLL